MINGMKPEPQTITHVGKYQGSWLKSKRCSAQAILLGLNQLIPSLFTLAQVLGKFLHGLSFSTYQSNTLVVVKKKLGGQQTGYNSLLFCFALCCRNGVTVRLCLSRLPGFRFLSICGLWTMFSLGSSELPIYFTPTSLLCQHLPLLMHAICYLCSPYAKWKEAFSLLT